MIVQIKGTDSSLDLDLLLDLHHLNLPAETPVKKIPGNYLKSSTNIHQFRSGTTSSLYLFPEFH